MKELTTKQVNQVSGGAGFKDWLDRTCSAAGYTKDDNKGSSSWGRTIDDVTRNLGRYHDNAVRSLTDIMCRVTRKC